MRLRPGPPWTPLWRLQRSPESPAGFLWREKIGERRGEGKGEVVGVGGSCLLSLRGMDGHVGEGG